MSELKKKLDEPMIVVAGDFNQWDIEAALADYTDITQINGGLMRGIRTIDKLFVNFSSSMTDSVALRPLETNPDPDTGKTSTSDHLVVMAKFKLELLR